MEGWGKIDGRGSWPYDRSNVRYDRGWHRYESRAFGREPNGGVTLSNIGAEMGRPNRVELEPQLTGVAAP